MSEWQPIETAPKDGTILAWDGENFYQAIFMAGEWRRISTFIDPQPTHWMPLPTPQREGK